MKKVYVKTLGCKVNTFDSHAIQNQLTARGYTLVQKPQDAEITVINSCSVTANAEKEARYLLRRYRRENPDSFQVVTGCYAQTDSARLSTLEEVDFIVPNEVKEQFAELLEEKFQSLSRQKLPLQVNPVSKNRQGHFKSSLTLFEKPQSEKTRAFVKIQDGCNGFCSYCLIPYARGASRSVPLHQIVEQLEKIASEGISEIVFTGIHLGDYGEDLAQPLALTDVLHATLTIPAIRRIRLSSLEPMEVSDELLELMADRSDIFCQHMHLPLQSGCDRILKLMRRKYDCREYQETLNRIRRYIPDIHLTADVIPGFPGETEEDFQETIEFIEASGLHGLHVFPYSQRPNTAAVRMPGHLDSHIVSSRAAKLRELSNTLSQNYSKRFIGKKAQVLWEKDIDREGRRLGKTSHYLNVASTISEDNRPGTISQVILKGFVSPKVILATAPLV